MSQPITSRNEDRTLSLIALVMVVTIAIIGIPAARHNGEQWVVQAALLLAFALLLTRMPQGDDAGVRSHLYLAVQSLVTAVLMIVTVNPTLYAVLFFILSAQAMSLFPRRFGPVWIGVFIVASAIALINRHNWAEGLITLPLYAAGYIFFGIFANALARADKARLESQALAAELQEANQLLQAYAARVEELALIEERNRLSREMHDTLGHRLTVAAVQLEGAQRLCPQEPERAAEMVGTVREQVREALGELRRTVATLRTPLEAELQLRNSLRRLATGFEEVTGLTIHQLIPDQVPELPSAHRVAIYRTVQEALTNVHRHAHANQVWLTLMPQKQKLVLLVADDGVGLPSGPIAESSFGLRGLRERAARLGGEVTLTQRPGGGTQLRLSLPLPEEAADE